MSTIQERVKALQVKAAQSRAAAGTAKPTDDLLLGSGFTKTEAAQIRATENARANNGLDPNSRGQQLSNDKFEETYGATAYDNKYGVTYSSPASGSSDYQDRTGEEVDYTKTAGVFTGDAPDMGEEESAADYRLRLLTWERDDARNAYNSAIDATKGVTDTADRDKRTAVTSALRDTGEKNKSKMAINPRYTSLTENEKIENENYFKKTGRYLVEKEIDISSGRSPIVTGNLSAADKKNQRSFNAKISKMQSQIDRGDFTPTSGMFTDAEMPFLENYLDYQEKEGKTLMQEGSDEEGYNQLGDNLREIELTLGLVDGQTLAFDSDGTPYIEENGEEVDPVARAKAKLEEKKQRDITAINEAYETEKAQIENANRVNGVISTQGERQLSNLDREHQRDLDETNSDWDDDIEQEILNEKKNQFSIDSQIDSLTDPRTAIAAAEQKAIMRQATGLMNSGASANWTGAITQAKAMVTTNSENPTKAEQFKSLDKKIFTAGFERSEAFTTAATTLGYDSDTIQDYMKSRGFTTKDIATQLGDYQKSVLGYTDEQIAAERDDMSIQSILDKDAATLTGEELDFLTQYEIDYPKKAERWKMKILHPEMSEAEIWKEVEASFKADKTTTSGSSTAEPSTYSDADDALKEALGTGLIQPEQADSFLIENFPEVKSTNRGSITKKYVKYNSSSQKYESLVPENYSKKTEDSVDFTVENDSSMSAVEREKKKQFNREKLENGKFVNGVYYQNAEKAPEPKKETTDEEISDDDFDKMYEEALAEME